MTMIDWLIAAATLLAPAALALCSVFGDASLIWFASPLRWPALHVLPVLALLPLLAPVGIRAKAGSRS